MIYRDGMIGAADRAASTNQRQPPLQMLFVVVRGLGPYMNLLKGKRGLQNITKGLQETQKETKKMRAPKKITADSGSISQKLLNIWPLLLEKAASLFPF